MYGEDEKLPNSVFGASRAKAEAVGEIVERFAGHMSRRESRLTRGAARQSPPYQLFILTQLIQNYIINLCKPIQKELNPKKF